MDCKSSNPGIVCLPGAKVSVQKFKTCPDNLNGSTFSVYVSGTFSTKQIRRAFAVLLVFYYSEYIRPFSLHPLQVPVAQV
jgi:hypothetical protein